MLNNRIKRVSPCNDMNYANLTDFPQKQRRHDNERTASPMSIKCNVISPKSGCMKAVLMSKRITNFARSILVYIKTLVDNETEMQQKILEKICWYSFNKSLI